MEVKMAEPYSPACGTSSSAKRASLSKSSTDKASTAEKSKRASVREGDGERGATRGREGRASSISPVQAKAGCRASKSSKEDTQKPRSGSMQAAAPKRKPSVSKMGLGVSPPASPRPNHLSC